jgi:hypothetical protein
MIKIIEAIVDEEGRVQLLERVRLPACRRAVVTILEEEVAIHPGETALLSEPALAVDWNRPEEEIERVCAKEALRRVEAADRGEIQSHPADEVHREVSGKE